MTGTWETYHQDKLFIDVVESEPTKKIDVVWKGVSDTRDPGKSLGPFLNRLADSLNERDVTVDFRNFEYMNSATVAPIIQFIKRLDSKAIHAVLRYDQDIHWQRVNFTCVKTIAQMLSRIQVEGS